MFKVYKEGKKVYSGSATETSNYLGVSTRVIYNLINDRTQYLPKNARCDELHHDGVVYTKRPKAVVERPDRDFERGYMFAIDGLSYEITDIEYRKNDVIYTINDDFKLRALQPYRKYNTLYIAVRRRLKNVVAKTIPNERRKEDNFYKN